MTPSTANLRRRILVIDDNAAIHDDFRKVLPGGRIPMDELATDEEALFGSQTGSQTPITFEVDTASQGQEGLAMVEQALIDGRPYAVAFVDGRMPPGWDGIETVSRIWKFYPDLQVVICTAYADYSWDEMLARLKHPDRLVILKKPFDTIEVRQLAYALSEKWHLLQEVKRKVQGLEAAVSQRTAHLQREIAERNRLEEHLRQAQKMECIGRLAGGVAHDFNNLLTVIEGYTALLLSDNLKPDQAESVQEISIAAERAASLTRQLLTFSRKQVFQLEEVNLNDVVQNLSKMLLRLLGEDIVLRVESANDPLPVEVDRGMIDQVVVNLAVNARDAMSRGGELKLRLSEIDVDDHYIHQNSEGRIGKFVRISVQDTGCGIPPENLTRIFEPFFTTKDVGKGTGLGLATVYGIVKQHQGWITVESKVNAGTTFHVLLPALANRASLPTKNSQGEAANLARGRETILLVEDEPNLRRLVASVLQRQGYQVLAAANGREALKLWQREEDRIDLVVSDLVMPEGMSGWDLVAHLQSKKPDLKVILTSGYSPELGPYQLDKLRTTPYLQKPFRPRTLLGLVRQCLDGKFVK